MEKRQHALRNIALKLNVSGTAEALEEQRLYKGSYGFVKLQVYVPKTQNTEGPLLTAFCTTVDELGREVISRENHRLWYVDEYELDGLGYLLFESLLPREFTEKATQPDGLKITLNYCDSVPIYDDNGLKLLDENGVQKRQATDVLISSRYVTTVYPGGRNENSEELDIDSAEAAQIADNTRRIKALEDSILHGEERVLVDVNVEVTADEDGNVQYYHVTKYFTGGETVELDYSAPAENPTIKTDLLTVFEFAQDSSWRQEEPDKGTYELAISPTQLGTSDNKYISILEQADGNGGFSTTADSHFKGSDGSILITDVIAPFDGRLLIFSGAMYTSNKEAIEEVLEGMENVDEKIQDLQSQIDEINYKAPTISSFSLIGTTSSVDLTSESLTREISGFNHQETSVGNIEGQLTFSYDGTTMLVDASAVRKSETLESAITVTFSSQKKSAQFTLSGKSIKNETFSSSVTISSYYPSFFGPLKERPTGDTISSLEKTSGSSISGTRKVTVAGNPTYIWFCTTGSISKITSSGFDVPFTQDGTLVYKGGTYKLYRASNTVVAGEYTFDIS